MRYLHSAMRQASVPDLFFPQLPWFRSLEGEPGYVEVIDELDKRKAAMRAEIAALQERSEP